MKDFRKKRLVDTSIFSSPKYKKWLQDERNRKEQEEKEKIDKELKETGLKACLFCF